jgi:hypothetical protein
MRRGGALSLAPVSQTTQEEPAVNRAHKVRSTIVLAVASIAVIAFVAAGSAQPSHDPSLTGVPTANLKATGYSPASRLSPELAQVAVAQGSTQVENPEGITTDYGYQNDLPSPDDPTVPQMLPTKDVADEAQKTEPDKNTYLVWPKGQSGPDAGYRYGTHFLYQGHELSAKDASGKAQSYITRINLDADAQHRVTLLATHDSSGNPLANIDGSTWDPWAHRLLFTTENASAPTYAATADYPSTVEDVSGALGRGGYEGIQNDGAGNLWIVEDIGGAAKAGTKAKQPNSFVYRYVPQTPGDLHDGKLQALQVLNGNGDPITLESQAALMAPDQVALHTHGIVFKTQWITVHDTAVDGTAPFNANTLAKERHATPFKRPENGMFRPDSNFREFYFDETGDTNALSPENGDPATGAGGAGGWGSIMKLWQPSPSANSGWLTMFYGCNEAHSGFDNVTFLSRNQVTFVEDAGDTLHTQRNALDSGYVFDVTRNYSDASNQPLRWLAETRDPSATIDSAFAFSKNEGDNEITGVHVSNGDPSPNGILGTHAPALFTSPSESGLVAWRWFYTQQHGDNTTYEVVAAH